MTILLVQHDGVLYPFLVVEVGEMVIISLHQRCVRQS